MPRRLRNDDEPATRADLYRAFYYELGISEREARDMVNLVISTLGKRLSEGREISLKDFGAFRLKYRKARTRKTKQLLKSPGSVRELPLEVRETVYIKFKPSKVITGPLKTKFYEEQLRKSKGGSAKVQGTAPVQVSDAPKPKRANQNLARLDDYRRSQDHDGTSDGPHRPEGEV